MPKKRMTRKALLKGPDEFLTLSARFFNFLSLHRRALEYIGLGIVVVAAAFFAVNTYLNYVEDKAQAAYNKAYYRLTEESEQAVPADPEGKAEDLFKDVLAEYPDTDAARLSLPQVAHGNFTQGEYDRAVSRYQEFLKKVSGHREYASLARLALAACHEAEGELDRAIESLAPILDQPDNPFRESALWRMARLYRLDNQLEKEKEVLEEFVETYEASPFLPMAKARLPVAGD